MTDEQELESVLSSLASPEPDERAAVLLVLLEDPTADTRVRAAVEALLDDRAVCFARPPAALTEVRWYAAHALAAERKAAGITEAVRVAAAVPPLDHGTLSELAEAAYPEAERPRSSEERFVRLRADGRLPTRSLSL